VESPLEWLLKVILSMEEILAAQPDLRGGNCHNPSTKNARKSMGSIANSYYPIGKSD
jgi:hypothetical protein